MDPVRSQCLSVIRESLKGRIDIEFPDEAFDDFELIPVFIEKKVCGVIARRGPELHFSSIDKRSVTKGRIKSVFEDTIKKYGKVITKVTEGYENGVRFVSRLGFCEKSRENGMIHYELTGGKYV